MLQGPVHYYNCLHSFHSYLSDSLVGLKANCVIRLESMSILHMLVPAMLLIACYDTGVVIKFLQNLNSKNMLLFGEMLMVRSKVGGGGQG